MKNLFQNSKKILSTLFSAFAIVLAIAAVVLMQNGKKNGGNFSITRDEIEISKLLEAREPNVVSGEDIDFKAFFLRDTDGDGYTEDMEEIDQEIGQTDYMFVEVNVKSEGQLKNGKITINDSNFKWKTTFIENNVIKNNYIGYTNQIELKDLNNGTQILLYGKIESKIGTNIHDYDKESLVTLTGTFVDNEQNETEITKESNLTAHWHGTTSTSIPNTYLQTYNIDNAISEEEFTANFSVGVNEITPTSPINKALLMNKQEVQMVIPELNGFKPTSVTCTSGNVVQNYNEETRTLSLNREATVDENGNITKSVSRSNTYSIKAVYPIEAYESLGQESVLLNVGVLGKSYGFNSEKYGIQESSASRTVSLVYKKISTPVPVVRDPDTWNFSTSIGTYSTKDGSYANRISKQNVQKIYDGNTYDDVTDTYPVCWTVSVGQKEKISKITLEQTSIDKFNGSINMDDYETTTGIYFSNVGNALGENGKIEVYNLEGGLLETFTKDNWGTYTNENPYKVNTKGIKVVTSAPVSNTYFYVYQIKELDDDKIAEDFTQEQFNNLTRIYTYAKGTIDVVEGQTSNTATVQNRSSSALYDMPISRVSFSSSPNEIANHETQNIRLTISASSSSIFESKWKNGTFLVKLPDEVISAELTSATISNSDVAIKSALAYKENEKWYVRIDTENEILATYSITLNLAINANPLEPTKSGTFKLYASNKECEKYNSTIADTFDINSNGLTNDQVAYRTRSINLIASHGLITEEYISNYNDAGSMTIAPNIAEIDRSDNAKVATVNVSLANNYTEAVDEITILGKIPFQGNTYVLNNSNLGSEYTAHMRGAISVPAELQDKATIYYTANENPTKDLTDTNNGWTTTVTDWSTVKCYLIDLGDYVLRNTENKVFSYEVEVPARTGYNKATFACHAVYYSLNTEVGKRRTETQPSKVGMQVVQKYNLELTKNKQGYNNILVPGATYKVVTKDLNDKDIVKIATTGSVAPNEGKLTLSGLYVGREYTVTEISTPDDYILNTNEVKFNTSIQDVNNAEVLTAYVTSGSFNGTPEVTTDANDDYLVKAKVQDEAKYTLLINTQDEEDNTLTDVRYAITGKNQGKMYKDTNGQVKSAGLLLNEPYEIQLMKSVGYYTDEAARTFTIVRDETTNRLKIVTEDEELANAIIVEEVEGQSTVTLTIKTEKIPTYNLQVLKIEEPENEEAELVYLTGAQFKFTSDDTLETEVYTVDQAEGIEISGLYNYVENKNTISGRYTLQEIKAPEGYSNNAEEITFYVEKTQDGLTVHIENENSLRTIYSAEIEENTLKLIIQDKPLFKLTKEDSEQVDEHGNPLLLPDAKFVIKELDKNRTPIDFAKDVNGNYVGEYDEETEQYIVTTDSNGQISVPLRAGEYMIKEVGYPEGYFAESNVQVFKIYGETEEEEMDDGSIKINYIEDLVDLSNDVNSGSDYSGKNLKLMRTLDFNDSSSYRDATSTSYGDINGNNILEDIKTELTTGVGFIPIGNSVTPFNGIFDGQGYEIQSLYINKNETNIVSYAGLWGYITNAEIKNLGVSGLVRNSSNRSDYAGGIAGYIVSSEISNCYNTGEVSSGCAGGIVGYTYESIIKDCYNNGRIKGIGRADAGGIAGFSYKSSITTSYNEGSITNSNRSGGIVGECNGSSFISLCYNTGIIDGSSMAGGISGSAYATNKETARIQRCYNMGKISSNANAGGIIGMPELRVNIYNCYNVGQISGADFGTCGITRDIGDSTIYVRGCYYINASNLTGDSQFGTPKNEAEMKDISFTYLLGVDYWEYDEDTLNNGYPRFRKELEVDGIVKIENIEDLVELSLFVNSERESYSGKTVRLMKSLDFNDEGNYKNANSVEFGDINGDGEVDGIMTELTTVRGFKPIGRDNSTPFKGTFDGQGYEIKNLYVNATTSAGLFGYISGAEIKNLGVSGTVNANGASSGGIAGNVNNSSTISNCYNTGKVSGTNSSGGIAGKVDNNSTISNSYNTGDVSTSVSGYVCYSGGIAGKVDNNSTISNCYNTGEVSSSSNSNSYAGGIAGYVSSSTIINSYNTGNISGNSNSGVIAAYVSSDSTISNSYYWDAITITGSSINYKGIVKTEQEMKGGNVLSLLGSLNWKKDENDLNNGFPVIRKGEEDSSEIIEVNHVEDLVKISNSVNTGSTSYNGKTIKLMRSLDFNVSSSYKDATSTSYGDINENGVAEDIKTELTTVGGFKPIGRDNSTSFKGIFDGQGYEIQNLYIDIEFNSNVYVGLFGYISNAEIKNLGVSGAVSNSSSNSYAGGIAGYVNNSSTISNCYNTGKVSGTNSSGGIAGFVSNYSTISNCYNTGAVSSNSHAGGIAGYVPSNSTISNCYNTGAVSSSNSYAGGIAGFVSSYSTISNCYNKGKVSGTGSSGGIAGLVSDYSTISNCYNTGAVSSNSHAGGIAGYVPSNSTISNCYNTGAVSSNSYAGGIAGFVSSYSTISNCYYPNNLKIEATTVNDYGTQKSAVDMCSKDFYNTLNVDKVWQYNLADYPTLGDMDIIPAQTEQTTELTIKNTIKKFTISTEIVGSEGGTIEGDDEIVQYGESNINSIKMIPNQGYEIVNITVNEKEIMFDTETDGSYTIPAGYFTNVKEDKTIVVTFAASDSIFTINKVDEDNRSKSLEGAKFEITTDSRTQLTTEVGDIVNNGTYYFDEIDGRYVSNSQEQNSTTANSYIPIDLTGKTGKYDLKVNAQISSEAGSDWGYATVNRSTTAPSYSATSGRFIYVSGNSSARDYTTTLTGGSMYYLHLGYYKNGSTNSGTDTFTINSVEVTPNREEFYSQIVTTNELGQARTVVPGDATLYVTEFEAPEGYTKNSNTVTYTMVPGQNNEITVTNKKQTQITVHHYYKDTTNKVAEDEIYKGDLGTEYTTSPKDDLEKLNLVKDEQGNYIIPEYAEGVYEQNREIAYYYEVEPVYLTIHHFVEGTENKLAEDETIEQVASIEFIGEAEYKVSANSNYVLKNNESYNSLLGHYNFVGFMTNNDDELTIDDTLEYSTDTEITYLYMPKEYEYTINYYFENGESVEEVKKAYYLTIIDTYTDNLKTGYYFDKEEALNQNGETVELPLVIGDIEENNVINVYYKQIRENRSVESKLNSFTDEDAEKYKITYVLQKTVNGETTNCKDENNEDITVKITGNDTYTFEGLVSYDGENKITYSTKVEKIEINQNGWRDLVSTEYTSTREAISDTSEKHTITRICKYTINYYYENVKDDNRTFAGTANYATTIRSYTTKNKTGYTFDRVEALNQSGEAVALPLVIGDIEENNVINVYYKMIRENHSIQKVFTDMNDSQAQSYKSTFVLQKTVNGVTTNCKDENNQDITCTITGNGTYTFEGLPSYEENDRITYSVKQVSVTKDGTTVLSDDEHIAQYQKVSDTSDKYTDILTTQYKVQNEWSISNPEESKNYKSTFVLYKTDGESEPQEVTDIYEINIVKVVDQNGEVEYRIADTADTRAMGTVVGNGTITFANLPKYENGKELTYSVEEVKIEVTDDDGISWNERNIDTFVITHGTAEGVDELITNGRIFNITTKIENGEGTITGEFNENFPEEDGIRFVESVYEGSDGTTDIEIIPSNGNEILYILINGEVYDFTPDQDGKVIITSSYFTNVTSDYSIEMAFGDPGRTIKVIKTDEDGNRLEGAKFRISSSSDSSSGLADCIGDMTQYDEYYFVPQDDGSYINNNQNVSDSVAVSYSKIDLSRLSGTYTFSVNAEISGEEGNDYGYIVISKIAPGEATSSSTSSSDSSAIVPEAAATASSGSVVDETCYLVRVSGEKDAQDYRAILEGGETYYIYYVYGKNDYNDYGSDTFTIRNISLTETSIVTDQIQKYDENSSYYFEQQDNGTWVSNNSWNSDTTAISYMEIDLENESGEYNLVINAKVSSNENYDWGYIVLSEDNPIEISTGSSTSSSTSSGSGFEGDSVRYIMRESGEVPSRDYTTQLEGGKKYYVYFVYGKSNNGGSGEDKFTINSVTLESTSEGASAIVVTNSNGEAFYEPSEYGTYKVKEIKAPPHYIMTEEEKEVELVSTEKNQSVSFVNRAIILDITTEVGENTLGERSGGTITGEYTDEYPEENYKKLSEKVMEAHDALNDIVINPSVGYKVESIKVNNKNYTFTPDENGNVVIPKSEFTNVTKNQHIVVTFAEKEKTITIVKTDKRTGNPLQGAKFRFTSNFEREQNLDYLISDMYKGNDDYYFVYNESKGTYTNNNQNQDNTVAYGYKIVDLSQIEGNRTLTINAKVSSESGCDHGYVVYAELNSSAATGTGTSTSTGTVENSDYNYDDMINPVEMFKIDGDEDSRDYTAELYGGKQYLVYFVYGKDSSNSYGTDTFTINSIHLDSYTGPIIAETGLTDENGIATAKITGYGEYTVQEIVTPDDYVTMNDMTYELVASDTNPTLNIENVREGENKSTYTVNYYEKGTTTPIETAKTSDEVDVGSTITSSEEVIDIDGFVYDSVDVETLTIGSNAEENVINIYYTRRNNLSYTIHHVLKARTRNIIYVADDITVGNQTFGDVVTVHAQDVPGYRKLEPTTADITITTGTNEYTFYYEEDDFNYTVHYFYDGVEDESKVETLTGMFNEVISTYEDKVEPGYALSGVSPVDPTTGELALKITNNSNDNVIDVFYRTEYKITTEAKVHTERYIDGTTTNIKGGSISGDGLTSYENVFKGEDSTKAIVIVPNSGYEIVSVKVNDESIDFEGLLSESGSLTLNAANGFFTNMDSNKHVEVEFRKKSSVIVKYLEKDTNEVLSPEETISGYDEKAFETSRKNVNYYRAVNITDEEGNAISSYGRITSDDTVSASGTMYADTLTIIYWYERIPAGILVKHIAINEVDKQNLSLSSGEILDEEDISGYVGLTETATRNVYDASDESTAKYKDYVAVNGPAASGHIVIAAANENSKSATYQEDTVVEIRFYYEKQHKVTTEVIPHDETVEDETISVAGGTISGSSDEVYEVINEMGYNTKEIVITPNTGYRVKEITINGTMYPLSELSEGEAHVITLGAGSTDAFFKNVQEDKHVTVKFERIPARVIVKYKDVATNEEVIGVPEKVVEGYVGKTYNEPAVEVPGYIKATPTEEYPEPISEGVMGENPIEIVHWYTKQFTITVDAEEGGTGVIEGDVDAEVVTRGNSNRLKITIRPNSGYKLDKIFINDEELDYMHDENIVIKFNSLEIPERYFTDIQENKHIVIKFAKIDEKPDDTEPDDKEDKDNPSDEKQDSDSEPETEPAKEKQGRKHKSKSVKTGDVITYYLAAIVISGVIMIVAIRKKLK